MASMEDGYLVVHGELETWKRAGVPKNTLDFFEENNIAYHLILFKRKLNFIACGEVLITLTF